MNRKIGADFKGQDILSLEQFDPASLQKIFDTTDEIIKHDKNGTMPEHLKGRVVTLLFFEPSSRTYGSFASAVKRLGGQTIDVVDPASFSSVVKGETLEDTIRVFECYSDAIVMRHPQMGTAKKAADAATIPILNAGDGVGEHPTQAILDLYTIYEKFKKLNGLTGVVAGDLMYGRTVHSLIKGLSYYPGNTLYLLSPPSLALPRDYHEKYGKKVKFVVIESENDIPKDADFWYWTRVQKERLDKGVDYEKVKNKFIVTRELVQKKAGKNTIILHPLPRVGEIDTAVDSDPRAIYLPRQVKNGLYTRMALLSLILGKI